jgi:cytochrome c peroxidase
MNERCGMLAAIIRTSKRLSGMRILTHGKIAMTMVDAVMRGAWRAALSCSGPRMRPARRLCWLSAALCLMLLLVAGDTLAQRPMPAAAAPVSSAAAPSAITDDEPITPIPQAPPADPRKLALGEQLFGDPRLSHDGTLTCTSCHDVHTNGADDRRRKTLAGGSTQRSMVLSVFNASLNFRLNWEGNYRTLEAHAESVLEDPRNMATSVDEVLAKLSADPKLVQQFRDAYGHGPDRASLLDAIATYERSLLTPGSRFDRWLEGDTTALTAEEQDGYKLFKSLGCVSCHQGVNVGGNLYERHGIFTPPGAPRPVLMRVPSLRNVATMAPYFQYGSTPTLEAVVHNMAEAQLDQTLSDRQVAMVVAFLNTLTGKFHGAPVVAPP